MPKVKMNPVDPSVPFAMPTLDVSEVTRKWLDVDYTPGKPDPSRLLDIYLPEEGDGPFPTIICIHGGAFWGGAKNDFQVMAYILTSKANASQKLNIFNLYPQKLVNLKTKTKVPLNKIDGYERLLKSLQEAGFRPLIRYSGTENLLRILLEAKDEKLLNEKMDMVVEFFEKKLNA